MLDQNPYPPYYVPQKRGAKDFFMMMFASMLGFIIASIAFSFLSFGIMLLIFGLMAEPETAVVSPDSVLKITMNEQVLIHRKLKRHLRKFLLMRWGKN